MTALILATIAPALPAHANRDTGTIIGGILGGIFGSQWGRGPGRVGTTVVGGLIGALIGRQVGRALEPGDHDALRDAQERAWRAERGEYVYWRGSHYGSRSFAYGSFRWEREGYLNYRGRRHLCRAYISEIYVRGRDVEVVEFHACRDRDGRWVEVDEADIEYGYGYGRPQRPEPYDDYGPEDEPTIPSSHPAPRPVKPSRPSPGPSKPAPPAPQRPSKDKDEPSKETVEWLATSGIVNPFITKLKQATDDKARLRASAEFYKSWQSHQKFLTLDQLGRVAETFRDDKERVKVVKLLRPVTDIRYGSRDSVLSKFRSSESVESARAILK